MAIALIHCIVLILKDNSYYQETYRMIQIGKKKVKTNLEKTEMHTLLKNNGSNASFFIIIPPVFFSIFTHYTLLVFTLIITIGITDRIDKKFNKNSFWAHNMIERVEYVLFALFFGFCIMNSYWLHWDVGWEQFVKYIFGVENGDS